MLATRACDEWVEARKQGIQGQTGNTPHPEATKPYREGSLLPGVIKKVNIDALRKGVTDTSVYREERFVGPVHLGHAEEVVNPGHRDVP